MNKQEYYRERYHKMYPNWRVSTLIYHDLISNSVSKDTFLLDVGCGHSNLLSDIYLKTPNTYGIDPDMSAINRNNEIKHIKKSYVEKMPFKDNFFDVVVCAWVLEHLKDPKKAFKEIFRVLKPGGKVIFLTPNSLNYNVWLIRLIPERFHDFLTRRLYNRQENDTFPKQYLINSPRIIDMLLPEIGFKKRKLVLNGDPTYISFNNVTFFLGVFLEKIFELRIFNRFKVHIIGEYIKEEK